MSTIGEDLDGARLDRAVATLAGIGRTEAAGLIAAGAVSVDDRAVLQKSFLVRAGMRLVIERTASPAGVPWTPAPTDELPEVPIRYEDDAMLIVAKPAGLVVHPAPGHRGVTLVDVLARLPVPPHGGDPSRPGIVHRLDRDTSGLLIVARTEDAHARLSTMLKAREITRVYDAVLDGAITHDALTIDAPVGRDPRARTRMAIVAGGRDAITDLDVIERFPEATRVRATLRTGRTHQIRVHAAGIDHPVSGDRTYRADPRLAQRVGLSRPFLHATHLRLLHPVTGTPVVVDEPLPLDLVAALDALRSTLPDQGEQLVPPHRRTSSHAG